MHGPNIFIMVWTGLGSNNGQANQAYYWPKGMLFASCMPQKFLAAMIDNIHPANGLLSFVSSTVGRQHAGDPQEIS